MTPPVPFRLRPAAGEDREAVYRLYGELFRSHVERIWGWNEEWQSGNFATEWNTAETSCVDVEEALAGYLQVKREPDQLYVLSLGLLPAIQGKGIGREIMEGLREEAAAAGLPLRLSVFRSNPRALAFYRRLGFAVREETKEFHRLEWCSAAGG